MRYYKYRHEKSLYFKTDGYDYWYRDNSLPIENLRDKWIFAGRVNKDILEGDIVNGSVIELTEKEIFIEII